MEPSPVLCCARRLIYYRLNVWTEGLTRPGISVWTCSASTTLSVGSGDRSAVCKSYQKTLWCLHPVDEDKKSADKGTEQESNSIKAATFRGRFSARGSEREKKLQLFVSIEFLNLAEFPCFFLNLSVCNCNVFHLNRKKWFIITLEALSYS